MAARLPRHGRLLLSFPSRTLPELSVVQLQISHYSRMVSVIYFFRSRLSTFCGWNSRRSLRLVLISRYIAIAPKSVPMIIAVHPPQKKIGLSVLNPRNAMPKRISAAAVLK